MVRSEHPTPSSLTAFVRGELASPIAEVLERHILDCPLCAATIEELDDASADGLPLTLDPLPGQRLPRVTDDPGCLPEPMIRVGQRIGPYLLEEFIGEGGNGVVYRARQLDPVQRRVAIKFSRLPIDGADAGRRMEQECIALASLRHRHIPHFYDAGVTQCNRPYIAMEFCTGVSLATVLRQTCFPLDGVFDLVQRVCEAVEHAHHNGIIHRDLKPSNILVQWDQQAKSLDMNSIKVIDFGIARILGGQQPRMTRVREVVGTPQYIAPEIWQSGRRCDTRGDVFSLGMVLYELLAGRLPSADDDRRGVPATVLAGRVADNEQLPPSCVASSGPGGLPRARQVRGEPDWIVMKAIDPDPDRRYQSAGELAEDLRRIRRGDVLVAGPPSHTRRLVKWIGRHRTLVAMLLTLFAVMSVTGVVIAMQHREAILRNSELAWRTYVGEIQLVENRFRRGHNAGAIRVLQRLRREPEFRDLWGTEADILWWQTHPPSLIAERQAFNDGIDDLHTNASGTMVACLSRRDQRIGVFGIDSGGLRSIATISSDQLRNSSRTSSEHWREYEASPDRERHLAVVGGFKLHPLITCVRFSPSQNVIAIGTYSGAVLIWDLDRQRVVRRLPHDGGKINRVEFSDDGSQLAAFGNRCFLTNLGTGETKVVFDDAETNRGDFRFDGKQLVVVGVDRNIHFVDTATRQRIARHSLMIPSNPSSRPRDVLFAPGGRAIIHSMSNAAIYRRSWDGKTLGERTLLGKTRNGAGAIRFNRDQSLLASTCDGGLLQYWDTTHLRLANSIVGNSGTLNSLSYSRHADAFLSGGEEGVLRMHRATAPLHLVNLPRAPQHTSMTVRPDGKRVAVGFRDGSIVVRDTRDLRVVNRLRSDRGSVTGMLYLSDGRTLAALHRSGDVAFRDPDRGTVRWSDPCLIRNAGAFQLKILRSQQGVAVLHRDGTVRIVDMSGKTARRWKCKHPPTSMLWAPALERFLLCSGNGTLDHYDRDGTLVDRLSIPQRVRAIHHHPEDSTIIGYGRAGTLVAMDPATGQVQREYRGHAGQVHKVLLLDGGRRFLSTAYDFTARIWDFQTGDEVLLKDAADKHFSRINVDATGRLIAIIYSNHDLELIDLRHGDATDGSVAQ